MLAGSAIKSAPYGRTNRLAYALGLGIWVGAAVVAAQLIIALILLGGSKLGVAFSGLNPAVFDAILALIVYTLTLVVVIGLPWWLMHRSTSRKELGFRRLPSWLDIVVGPLGMIPYVILSGVLLTLAAHVPGFDSTQAQSVGFQRLAQPYEYVLAFVTLVALAPLAEELVFRGYLYGKLRKRNGIIVSVIITSLTFGILHGQWNVGIDVFALSIVLCLLREKTGSIWAGVLLHATKNAIAFYFLFINTGLADTLLK